VDLIKPNAKELSVVTGLPVRSDAEAEAALAMALSVCEARAILVTRAASGMSLMVRGEPVRHYPGRPRQIFDVSGAGDTALAALGAALAAGEALPAATAFALAASGLAVGKPGTAVVTPEELLEAQRAEAAHDVDAKILNLEGAAARVLSWRAGGARIGFTNGCFDILHRGHVSYLGESRRRCDRLVVALNTDQSVKRLKGDDRPINDLESRALVLAGLACVDLVIPFAEDTPLDLIRRLQPDILMKGADYTESEVVGAADVRAHGGEVALIPLVEGHSTTATLKRWSERP
jgi:D-beta-D-heptose 7-phosphate kinase/D-beta-D-heptose 1-phosphate adenosyltransferase